MALEQQSLKEFVVYKADPDLSEQVQGSVPTAAIHSPASAAVHGSKFAIPNEQQNDTCRPRPESAPVPSSAVPTSFPPLSLRGEIFHVFISYRVKSESDLVGELYHQLISTGNAAKIPAISKWPSSFKQPDVTSSRIHVFWDAKTLAPGLTWKDSGFVSALGKSLVFAPMLSLGVVESWCRPVADYVDNVLLELILALEFNKLHALDERPSSIYPCKYVVPVFVDELFGKKSEMSNDVARATMTEAARLLDKYGLRASCEYSPLSVFTALSAFQGVRMNLYDKQLKQQAIGAAVKEIVTAVTMCIQQSSVFMDDFKAHHPRARELCDWLQMHNLSHYTGIIARHGITSVHALSVLDVGSAVPILAEDCALSCGESRMQAIVCLSSAVAKARSSELSLPLAARFDRFVDTDASVLSAIFSSCGIDTILTKWEILSVLLLLFLMSLSIGAFVLDIVDHPFLCISSVANPIFWFVLSACALYLSTWPIFFGGSIFRVPSTDFKPRKIIVVVCLLLLCKITFIMVYIKAVHFGSIAWNHSILCQSALERGVLTVSYDTCYLYEALVIFPVQFVFLCVQGAAFYARQELALRVFICSLLTTFSMFFGFMEMLHFENLRPLRFLSGGFIAICILALVIFESLNKFSKTKAAAHLKKDEEMYDEMWERFSRDERIHPANTLSDEICARFEQVLENPSAASRWFSWPPCVLQEHLSVDNLFDDVELVDVAFQQLVQCWLSGCDDKELGRFVQQEDLEAFKIIFPDLKGISAAVHPGPVKQVTRSISKTVRSYRGNFRRLTDLVRTAIEFASFDDIRSFLRALHEKSMCSPEDFASFWPSYGAHSRIESSLGLRNFEERSSSIVMQILRIRNRFDPSPEYKKHLFGGYRDISLKIKMAFVCQPSGCNSDRVKFVPMRRWRVPGTKRLVIEIQLHHQKMKLGCSEGDREKHHSKYVESRDMINA